MGTESVKIDRTDALREAAQEVVNNSCDSMEHLGGLHALADALAALAASPNQTGTTTESPKGALESARLRDAVKWVLRDASYKAPEQIGIVAERWVAKLTAAMETREEEL